MTTSIVDEMRYAMRRVWARPVYFLIATSVLAVGMAATLFVVSMLNGLAYAPSPFVAAERTEQIGVADPDDPDDVNPIELRDYRALLPTMTAFEKIGISSSATINLGSDASVERHAGTYVNADLFAMVGVKPLLGRAINSADGAVGAPASVMISHAIWRDRFAADPGVIGRDVRVNAQPARIVGVMPEGFTFPQQEEVWVSLALLDESEAIQDMDVEVFGQRREGVSREQADAPVAAALARYLATGPEVERDQSLRTVPAREYFVSRQTIRILGVMLATAFGVLLLACANVANLQVARVAQRARELALRAALGARRGRLLISVLAECVVLVVAAVAIALPMAQWAVGKMMRTLIESGDGPPAWMRFGIDANLVFASALIALVAIVVAGLAPAWRATSLGNAETLREGTRGTRGSASRIGRTLVVVQVALSCVLLVGAGVMVQGLRGMANIDTGIHAAPTELLTARIAVFPEQYATPAARIAFFERVVETVRAHPEVRNATVSESLPASSAGDSFVAIEGFATDATPPLVWRSAVGTDFFKTLAITPLAGRGFDARDSAEAQPVAIVDQRFAERWWPGQEALNRRIQLDPEDEGSPWLTIVGVVPFLRLDELDDAPKPSVLVPLAQRDESHMSLMVHVRGADANTFAPTLVALMREVDPNTPVYWVMSFDQVLADSVAGQRVLAWIYSVFGAAGLLLAAAGLYGVLAHWVEERTREIGVRRAIGATSARIVGQVSTNAAWLVGTGLLIGGSISVPWAGVMAAQLNYTDGNATAVIALVMLAIVVAASVAVAVPSRRALGIAPSEAIRCE